jgi:uncharacterized membrane protein YbhN (UPF0104 family)
VVERVLDLTAVLGCLFGGLALGAITGDLPFSTTLRGASGHALAIVAVIWLLIALSGRRIRDSRRVSGTRILREVIAGISSLNLRSAFLACASSGVVWLCEASALWFAFRAYQIELTVAQTMLLIGASSLSTLIPSAPGYVGSFQLVFVLAMAAFQIPETVGLVVSVSIQIFLFGSVTLIALAIYFARWATDFRRQSRSLPISCEEKTVHG